MSTTRLRAGRHARGVEIYRFFRDTFKERRRQGYRPPCFLRDLSRFFTSRPGAQVSALPFRDGDAQGLKRPGGRPCAQKENYAPQEQPPCPVSAAKGSARSPTTIWIP